MTSLRDLVLKALTKRKAVPVKTRATRFQDVTPSERLVLAVQLIIVTTFCLTALEFAHIIFLKAWSSEVFAGITGLVGTLTGVLLGRSE